MKSDRRHELETNALADRLGSVIETGKPIGGLVAIGIALILVAALGYGAFNSWTQKANSEAWTEFYLMSDESNGEAFNTVIESFPSSTAAPWARQAMADSQLARGIESLYNNRAAGESMIGEAITSYKSVLDATYDAELRYKASIGLAQAYESLGKLDEAIKQYEQVEKSPAPSGITKLARERMDWLRSEPSKNFYRWFASLKPAPDAPPTIPGNLSTPPTSPDLAFPAKEALGLGGSASTGAKDEKSTPAGVDSAVEIKSENSSGIQLSLPNVPSSVPGPGTPTGVPAAPEVAPPTPPAVPAATTDATPPAAVSGPATPQPSTSPSSDSAQAPSPVK